MSNFTYVVAGVSKNNDPILATTWQSSTDKTDEIIKFLSSKTDFHEENETRQMEAIYRFVPNKSGKDYPKSKNPRLIGQIEGATGTRVVINCTWIEDITDLQSYAFSKSANKIFLLRVNKEGLLEWRVADLLLTWNSVDYDGTRDEVIIINEDELPF